MKGIIFAIICLLIFTSSLTLNAQWARTYGGSEDDYPRSILQTSDGGYIIFGSTESFGFSNGYSDIWILKLNALGDIAWQKTTQFSGNLYCSGNPFLVVFRVHENSGPSREVYVDFGLVTIVNEGSTTFSLNTRCIS